MTPPRRWWRTYARRPPRAVGVVGLYLVLAVAWTWPVWVGPGPRIPHVGWPGYASDYPTYTWQLAWVPYALSHGWSPFYTHLFNAPQGANIAFPGPPLPWLLLVWPVTALAGVVVSYNTLIVLAIVVSATAGWIACRHWVGREWAAVVGGAAFGFSPFVLGQGLAGHPNLMLVPTIPLASVLFDEVVIRQRWSPRRAGLCVGALVSLQLLTASEILVIIGLTALGTLAGCVWIYRAVARRHWPYVWRTAQWAALGTVPGLGIEVWGQVLTRGAIHGPLLFGGAYAPTLASLLLPGPGQAVTTPGLVHFFLANAVSPTESLGYIGIPFCLLLWLLWRRARPVGAWVVAITGGVVLFMLGPGVQLNGLHGTLPLPEAVLTHVPLLQDLLPDRLSSMVDWLLALSLALFCDTVRPWVVDWRPWIVIGCVVATWLPTVGSSFVPARTPAYFQDRMMPAHSVLLVYPFAQNANGSISELWQAQSGFRFAMTGGYYQRVSDWPPNSQVDGPPLTPVTQALDQAVMLQQATRPTGGLRRALWAYLDAHSVTAVVIGPGGGAQLARRLLTQLFQRLPSRRGGVWIWTLRQGSCWLSVRSHVRALGRMNGRHL